MRRREHHVDGHVRQLPLVSDRQASLESDRHAERALFEEIVAMPLDTDKAVPSPGRRRIPRPAFVLVATLALVSLAAVGWAVIDPLGSSTTAVACHTEGIPDSGVVIDLVTGDPVADCAATWERHTGHPAPALVAYDNGHGGVAVMPTAAPTPEGWQPLGAGTAQDARVIELRRALDDHIAGLPSKCHVTGEAQAVAARELERLGLAGWSVAPERGEADGIDTCTYFYLDPDSPKVVLIPREDLVAPPDAPYAVFARDLGVAIEDDCLAIDDAAQLAWRVADDIGIGGDSLAINEIVDADANCSRAYADVAGLIEVVIHGPE